MNSVSFEKESSAVSFCHGFMTRIGTGILPIRSSPIIPVAANLYCPDGSTLSLATPGSIGMFRRLSGSDGSGTCLGLSSSGSGLSQYLADRFP